MSHFAPVFTENKNKDLFARLTVDAMQELLSFSSHLFQKLVILCILKMKKRIIVHLSL